LELIHKGVPNSFVEIFSLSSQIFRTVFYYLYIVVPCSITALWRPALSETYVSSSSSS